MIDTHYSDFIEVLGNTSRSIDVTSLISAEHLPLHGVRAGAWIKVANNYTKQSRVYEEVIIM